MKNLLRISIILLIIISIAGIGYGITKDELIKAVDAQENGTPAVKAYVKEKLIPLCTNQVFVDEVKKQNDKKATPDEIKKIDKEWSEAEKELPIQKEKMSNACAEEIKKVAKDIKGVGEVFVMDNQGANVGQNKLTSDYWQGDEPKWEKAYNAGKGGVLIEKDKLDKSTNIVEQKVNLPILDAAGNAIGAISIGVAPKSL